MKRDSIARRRRKRRPKAMDVRTLRSVLTVAITALEDDLLAAIEPEEKRRTASVLAQVAGVYTKMTAEHDWQQELADVRKELHDATTRLSGSKGASASTRPPAPN